MVTITSVTFNYLRDKFSQIVGRLNPSQLRNINITRIHPILTITKQLNQKIENLLREID